MDKNEIHEELVDFVSKYKQYQSDGKRIFKKKKKAYSASTINTLTTSEINSAVVLFTDILNIENGSSDNVDFYRLMQAYILVPEKRDEMNKLVSDILSYDYNTKKATT